MEKEEALKDRILDGDKMDVFTLETNVRKMIRDLLEPIMNKAHDDRKDMEIIRKKINEFDNKVKDIHRVVFNQPNSGRERKDVFEEIYDKISETNAEITKLKELQQFEVQARKDSIEENNDQIKKFIKSAEDLRNKHLLILNDFHEIEKHIKDVQSQLNLDIKNSTNKLVTLIEALYEKQNTTDAMSLKNNTRIEYHNILIEKLKENHENLHHKSLQKWTEFSSKEELYQPKEEFDSFREKIQFELDQSKKEHEEFSNNILTIENYTDKYVPINTHNAILEAFRNIMPPKFIQKLKEYEEKVFKATHKVILEDEGIGNLIQKKEELIAKMAKAPSPQLSKKATRRYRNIDTIKTHKDSRQKRKQELLVQYSTMINDKSGGKNLSANLNPYLVKDLNYKMKAQQKLTGNFDSDGERQSNGSFVGRNLRSPPGRYEGSLRSVNSNEGSQPQYETDSSNPEFVLDLNKKVEILLERFGNLEVKVSALGKTDTEDLHSKMVEIQKWLKRVEGYVSQLHSELEDVQKLNKQFKFDLYEKLKTQRKITGELDKKVTSIFSQRKTRGLILSGSKKSKEVRMQSIG
ncbi:unnamed protein product [Moneuplotes crassus]|uniref:Uncharacterized protein n=1 Tax=Euplotes crassus TaxID=5936 RepID=A0AAD1X7R0_EUPCR|nr:unnamed protein product [Moneuplotes crassus]